MRNALLVSLIAVGLMTCSKEFANQPMENLPPETSLFLNPDSALRRTSSQQHLRWWGVDPDGFVRGFLFSFDSLTWHYTARNDSLFALSLNTVDTTYRFFVSAFDDHGNGRYDVGGSFGPEPFTDLNGTGVWENGEPYVDVGTVDMTPASLAVPIENSAPTVAFVLRSDVPETTYTVATFQWSGNDFDGNETIANYYYVLDDTSDPSKWRALPGNFTSVTLFRDRVLTATDPLNFRRDSLTPGDHVFYLKARDVAGAESPIVRMPAEGKFWHVKVPLGDFLIVDDYSPIDASATFYRTMFDTLMSGRLQPLDILDIKRGASSIKRGDLVPALINPTLTETFKLFRYIFWYADNAPSLEIAQATLPEFKRAGGKVLFSSGFPENVTAQGSLVDFAPIENVESSYFATRLNQYDTLLTVSDPTYPTLVRDNLGTIYAFPRGLMPRVGARVLYRMQTSTRWVGQPVMGVKDADEASFVLLGVLLHRFGIPATPVAQLLRKVYAEEFGVQ